ncbi:unnamed protein product [Chilo suppressalis]|uniref:Endonuclease-reverse transcriptase n=1 Tax=Chilo suppressalis TaxID=168631 RepID=A0ABN8B048_CHISP|nr:unnamed protein product [Chilo suppressalis]
MLKSLDLFISLRAQYFFQTVAIIRLITFVKKKHNLNMSRKRKTFNSCILPCLIYGSETWTLTKAQREKLVVTGGTRKKKKSNGEEYDWLLALKKIGTMI